MDSPMDIKPNISGPATPTLCPLPRIDGDIKFSLSDLAGTATFRDFRKEREVLKKQYDLEKRNLDLEEENRLLRSRPAVKIEPGAWELKPDLTRLAGGGALTPLDLGLLEDGEDEDDIVFVREVKGGRARPSSSGRIPSDAPVKAGISPFQSSITLNLEEDTPSTSVNPDRRSQSKQPPLSDSEQPERASPSLPPRRKPSIVRGKSHRRGSSAASHGSSGTESSDSSDDTCTGRSPTPVWGATWKEGKKARRRRRVDTTTSQRGRRRSRAENGSRSRDYRSAGTLDTAKMSGGSEDGKEEADDSISGEDEYTGPYKGPHLHVISVEWINDRLDRSFQKYRMSFDYLGQWAAWWPRTKVAKHHRLDPTGIWLLTMAVHKWWSDLLEELKSPDVEWPEGLDEAGQEHITMKVEEITLAKESAMVAAKRIMLKDGDATPSPSELLRRHGTRKTTEG